MRNRLVTLCAAMLFSVPAMAQGDVPEPCRVSLDTGGGQYWRGLSGNGYLPSDPRSAEPAKFSVVHEGDACRVAVVFDVDVQRLSGPGGELAFDILDNPQGRSALDPSYQSTQTPFFSGTLGSDNLRTDLMAFFQVDPNQQVRAGSYLGGVSVVLYVFDEAGNASMADQSILSLRVNAIPILSVNSDMIGPSRNAVVDFGDLSVRSVHDVDFNVLTNVPLSVRIESANNGRMRHVKTDAFVSYKVTLDGRPLNLSAGSDEQWLNVPAGSASSINMMLSTDGTDGLAAGIYEDEMTIVFRSE